MTLHEWAQRWQIPQQCFSELIQTAAPILKPSGDDYSESRVQSMIRLQAARAGNVHLFRNNVGAGKAYNDKEICPQCAVRGRFIRWGLANDSKAVNEVVKSGDFIGWESFVVTQAHVGTRIAKFLSRETKPTNWQWTGTPHELGQLNWANLVNAAGGDAKFTTGAL